MPTNNNNPKNILNIKQKLNLSENCENLSLVFYQQKKSSDFKEVLYAREIIRIKSRFGSEYDFHSVNSSRYGVRIPANATHWCLAVLGAEPQVLYSSTIPSEMTMQVVDYAAGRSIYFNRFNKNVKFLIGVSHEVMRARMKSRKKQNPKLKLISELIN